MIDFRADFSAAAWTTTNISESILRFAPRAWRRQPSHIKAANFHFLSSPLSLLGFYFFICQVFKFSPLLGSKIIFLASFHRTRRPPLDRFAFSFRIISRHRFSCSTARTSSPEFDYEAHAMREKKVKIVKPECVHVRPEMLLARIDNRQAIPKQKADRNVTTESRKSLLHSSRAFDSNKALDDAYIAHM